MNVMRWATLLLLGILCAAHDDDKVILVKRYDDGDYTYAGLGLGIFFLFFLLGIPRLWFQCIQI